MILLSRASMNQPLEERLGIGTRVGAFPLSDYREMTNGGGMITTMETTPVPGVFSRAETRTEVDLGGTFPLFVFLEEHLDAFEELVTRHSRGVHRALVDIVGNVHEALNAFQPDSG
jgi:hypothetical protein